MKKWAEKQAGFTIVELLIVVVVIAILAAITIVAYNGIQNRAKSSSASSEATQAFKRIAMWQVDNTGQTPSQMTFDSLLSSISGTTFQYTRYSGESYCATATKSNVSYYFTNTSGSPTAGACFGHGLNGGTAIINLISNPSFESNTTGWSISSNMGTGHPASGGANGSRYYAGSRSSTAAIGFYSPTFDVVAGDTYMGSMNVRVGTTRQAFLRFRWFDASNAEILPASANTASNGNGFFLRMSYSAVAPAGAVTGRLDVVMNTVNAATSDFLDIDGVMVTRGSTLYNYADGSSSGWSWQSTANNSASSGPAL